LVLERFADPIVSLPPDAFRKREPVHLRSAITGKIGSPVTIRQPQARVFIKKARALDRSNVYLIYASAVVDTINNEPADAVKKLTVALEKGFSPKDVEVEPEFIPLRSRADFQSMMNRFTTNKR
jgi:hypothetical protein